MEFNYDETLNTARCITTRRHLFLMFFSLLAVVGSESVAVGDLLNAPNRTGTGFSGHRGFELGNHPLQPVRNSPTTINGRSFSGHALDQMQNRGIPPSVVQNAIENGVPFAGNRPGTQGFYDAVNRVRVIINSETGNVITVIPGGG